MAPKYRQVYYAVTSGDKDKVLSALKTGADVNEPDSRGNTALHEAVSKGSKELTEILLRYGAKVNVQEESGLTPLHYAALSGDSGMVKFLLEHGADVNLKDNNGKTPFNIAEEKGDSAIEEMIPPSRSTQEQTPPTHPPMEEEKPRVEEPVIKETPPPLPKQTGQVKREPEERDLKEIFFKNVVLAVLADNLIQKKENDILHELCKTLDIDVDTAGRWAKDVQSNPARLMCPVSQKNRRKSLSLMIAACKIDGIIALKERRLLEQIAKKWDIGEDELKERIRTDTFEGIKGQLA